jgi:hypothetical protein
LLERELDAPHLIEYTQVIIGESDRLQSLVNRLLTPHRLPSFRLINVHEVLLRVKGVVQAEFPHIPVALDFDISLPEFDADPEQLMQSALNIVRNAAQALSGTTADPRVGVSTRVARNLMLGRKFHRLAVAVAVEDNGPAASSSRCARRCSSRSSRGARAAAASGSRSRRPSSRSTAARSSGKAAPAAPYSRSSCRSTRRARRPDPRRNASMHAYDYEPPRGGEAIRAVWIVDDDRSIRWCSRRRSRARASPTRRSARRTRCCRRSR